MSQFLARLLVVLLFTLYRHASGWIPAVLLRAAPKHSYAVRHSTSLLLTPREIERMSGGSGDEDDGQAEEAARAARETLERMWSSSAKDSNEHPEDQLDNDANIEMLPELPELAGELEEEGAQGMEVRRESPFPSSSERGALEAAAASQKALVAGKRGLVIDIEVKQLDDEHREFEPDIMIHFIMEVGKSLAAVIGKTKIMLRGDQLASTATEALRRENMEAAEGGIGPREDISFCSMRTPDLDDEGDPDSMEDFAAVVARQIGEEERLIMIVGPRSNADVIVLREVVKSARGRPVVLVNPRMTFMPRETSEYDTVYLLRQFNVQPIKTDPRRAAKRSPFKITSRQRRQQAIFSELGQMVPKVLTTRAFPDDFKLYLDIDGKGFRLEDTYDEKPHPSVVCFKAQTIIEEAQRQMNMEAQMSAVSDKQREMLAMWEEEEDDDDDDDDDDDVIVPKRLTNDEIDARLRD